MYAMYAAQRFDGILQTNLTPQNGCVRDAITDAGK